MASLGIALIHSTPYRPQGKGKIERLIKTIRMSFLPTVKAKVSLVELNELLWAWIEKEYHQNVHSVTREKPLERYLKHVNQVPVLIIDEAHLMRLEVFAQIHTFMQFDFDSKSLMPIILSGHSSLLDKLMYHTSRPLASRVVGRTHLDGLKLKEMEQYLKHHLEISGIKEQLFSEQAILAIHQTSGGLLRRANLLAKGSLMAAAFENCSVVSPEHVRIASTEII